MPVGQWGRDCVAFLLPRWEYWPALLLFSDTIQFPDRNPFILMVNSLPQGLKTHLNKEGKQIPTLLSPRVIAAAECLYEMHVVVLDNACLPYWGSLGDLGSVLELAYWNMGEEVLRETLEKGARDLVYMCWVVGGRNTGERRIS